MKNFSKPFTDPKNKLPETFNTVACATPAGQYCSVSGSNKSSISGAETLLK